MTAELLPMFPLGSVVFPSAVLPLHVFEPRYRELVRHCLEGEAQFGTVLIARGSEVGGGDLRCDVGTRLRIAQAVALDDGRWLLATVGIGRIRVVRWLPDAPYPRAEVASLPDGQPGPGSEWLRAEAVRRLRRALAMAAELGEPTSPLTAEVADDPVLAAYEVARLAPLGPADAQRVLEAHGTEERLSLLVAMLDEQLDVLAQRLAGR